MSKRDDVLNHAKQLFAEKGFEGAVMDELASLAGVNKATIYYYFKDKESLYNTVFKNSIEQVYEDIKDELENTDNPKSALKLYIDAFYEQAKKDETFIRILMREVASNGKHFPKDVVEMFINVVSILDDILVEGYKRRVFNRHDTKVVHFMIIGAISYFVASEPIRRLMPDSEYNIPGFLTGDEDIGDSLYKIILNGLEKNV